MQEAIQKLKQNQIQTYQQSQERLQNIELMTNDNKFKTESIMK